MEVAEVLESHGLNLDRISEPPLLTIEETHTLLAAKTSLFSSISSEMSLQRMDSALSFLHDLGRIIYFRQKDRSSFMNRVILVPPWLTRCLACIVTQEVKGTYIKNGKILHSDLTNFVWRSNSFPPRLHEFLIHVLESYEVMVKMPHQLDVHIVPSLLPTERPSNRLKMFPPFYRPQETKGSQSSIHLLNREYRFQFMPSGLVTRLIVRFMKYFDTFIDSLYWRHGIMIHMHSYAGEYSYVSFRFVFNIFQDIITTHTFSWNSAMAIAHSASASGPPIRPLRHPFCCLVPP
jgi:hypothetical protein